MAWSKASAICPEARMATDWPAPKSSLPAPVAKNSFHCSVVHQMSSVARIGSSMFMMSQNVWRVLIFHCTARFLISGEVVSRLIRSAASSTTSTPFREKSCSVWPALTSSADFTGAVGASPEPFVIPQVVSRSGTSRKSPGRKRLNSILPTSRRRCDRGFEPRQGRKVKLERNCR